MIPYPLFVDTLPEVLDILALNLSFDVAEDLKGWVKGQKRATIQPTGGTVTNPYRVWSPRYDVNCYAGTKPETYQMSYETIQALYMLKGTVLPVSGVVVTDVECSLPSDITDPINLNPRWVFDVTISYRTPTN